MTVPTVFKVLLLAVLVAGVWHHASHSGRAAVSEASADDGRAALVDKIEQEVAQGFSGSRLRSALASYTPVSAPPPVRKCLHGGSVLYTDERCPAGAYEDTLRRGTFTVLPKPGTAAPAEEAAPLRLARRDDDGLFN